jgi:prepilin signal peptidase PulO-like enzyme (type II secretory pathway)
LDILAYAHGSVDMSLETARMLMVILGFWLGACLGSFANAAAMRTVAEKKWWGSERSTCDSCGAVLSAFELIPVFSYLIQLGKCRHCGAKIAPRHFFTELGAGLVGMFMAWQWGINLAPLALSFVALLFLLFCSLTDLETGYIYDSWAIAMAVAGLVLRVFGGWPAVLDGVLGAALGFGLIFLIVIVSRGGMGFGDAMLMLGVGAVFGWKMTILCLYLGFFAGGIVTIPMLIMKKATRKTAVPLGPFLAAGSIAAIFTAQTIFGFLGFELPWPWYMSNLF